MESAFAWIGRIIEWFGQFIPRIEIVDTTHGALKFVRGAKIVKLGPGMHVYWPLTTKFEAYPVARQASDLRTQTLVTKDDKVLAVGGLIVYEIYDLEPLLAHTWHPENTIRDICISAIHDVCCQLTWDELKDKQRSGALDRELNKEARKSLDKYGVKVLKTTLTDLAPCRVIKINQSTATDGL
jgi:regulator of protease activity HflC (stomatin/prohibitin superfamily)